MPFETNMRAVIYARVSTEQQSEGSIEEQIRRCKQYCELKGYTVVAEYTDVGSGMKTDRPQFEIMMSNMNEWDICVAYKLDRFHRSSGNASAWAADLNNQGKNFAAIDIDIDTSSATGLFIFRLMTSLAQLEVEQTRERTKMGLKAVKRQGRWLGRPPYGYDSKKKITGNNGDTGILSVNLEEADVVKLIYGYREAGYTHKEIAQNLTEQGFETRKGTPWAWTTVRDILKNRSLYEGVWVDDDGEEQTYEWGKIL